MATESVAAPSPFLAYGNLDLRDEMDGLLMQITALIMNTYGGSGEGFRGMHESLQDAYMGSVSGMAFRIESVWKEIERRRQEGVCA